MRLSLLSGLLLVLFLSLETDASRDVVNAIKVPGYRQVQSADELWRFQAGDTDQGLTLGTKCLCILSMRNLFLAGRDKGVYNEIGWCKEHEHWELKSMGDGQFALKRRGVESYISCGNNGAVYLRGHAKGDETFHIFINNSEEKISFYSPTQKKFVRVDNKGKAYCNTHKNADPGSIFYGWKTGDKSAWEPSERFEEVATFDNTKSQRIKKESFTATLGVVRPKNAKAGVRVDEPLILTSTLSTFFTKNYQSENQLKWSEQDKSIWKEAQKKTITRKVYPGDKLKLMQIVGVYGPFEIYAEKFEEVPILPSSMNNERKPAT